MFGKMCMIYVFCLWAFGEWKMWCSCMPCRCLHCQRRAGVGVVARDVDKPVQDVVWETLHLTLHQVSRCTVGLGFVLGCMFRILQVAFGCLGSCVWYVYVLLAVGTCKMCILCSVLVALEAVEVIHMSDLYSFARIHIHRKEIWFIPRTSLYI